jgi:hypothetical protein
MMFGLSLTCAATAMGDKAAIVKDSLFMIF